MPRLVRYVGDVSPAQITLPDGAQFYAESGNSYEVGEAVYNALLEDPSHWAATTTKEQEEYEHRRTEEREAAERAAEENAALTRADITGAWATPTLSGKVEQGAGVQTVRVRLEGAGAHARLRGAVKATAEAKAGEALLTVAAEFRPASTIAFHAVINKATAVTLELSSAGALSCTASISKGSVVPLDGLTWNIT